MGCNCGSKKTNNLVSQVLTANPNTEGMCSCGKPKSECGKGECKCHHEHKACMEDHTTTLVESVFTTTVTATDTWVMPAVDDCVQLHLKDVTNILPGAILWNKSVGSLHVSAYDATTGYVTACNEGEEGNAEAGSDFPSCMAFQVGIPTECDCSDNWTGPCLAADVTSPGVGETTEVSVTTVSGLFIGDIIDIAGFMYKIVAINDVHTIVVKNEGYGAPLGTVIKNDPNCTGKPCTVKITVVNSDDPCAKDPVHEGVLIVCDEGERKPFEGTADNQITYWDNEDKKWKLKIVRLTEECTNLTVDLTLDPLISTYVVTVAKTSIFKAGDIVYIEDIKFTVDSIVNATQMRITIDQAVATITVIEEGSSICLGDCCLDQISDIITIPNGTTNNSIVSDVDEILKNENESTVSVDSTPFTTTVTISAPSSVGNRPIIVVGTAVLTYQAIGFADTHYYKFVDKDTAAQQNSWTGMCYIVPPRVCLSGNVEVVSGGVTSKLYPTQSVSFSSAGINASPTANEVNYGSKNIDGLYVYNAFYATPTCKDAINNNMNTDKTGPSKLPVTQTLVLPISKVIQAGESITLSIIGKIKLLNARGELSEKPTQAYTDEQIKLRIRQTSIAYSLAWIVQ